jgi:DNA-binding CsgD family transcriptional regulator
VPRRKGQHLLPGSSLYIPENKGLSNALIQVDIGRSVELWLSLDLGGACETGSDAVGRTGLKCTCGGSHVTFRQAEVLALVAGGLTLNEAACRLGIALCTVEDHLRAMRQRARARTSHELVARAFAAGVFIPGSWPPRLSGRLCVEGVLSAKAESSGS